METVDSYALFRASFTINFFVQPSKLKAFFILKLDKKYEKVWLFLLFTLFFKDMNKHQKVSFLILIIIFVLVSVSFYFYQNSVASSSIFNQSGEKLEEVDVEPQFRIERTEIVSGDTFALVASRAGLTSEQAALIYECAQKEYDLASIKAGSFLELVYSQEDNKLQEILYKIDSEDELAIIPGEANSFNATCRPINYDTKIVAKEAVIEDSLYLSALKVNMDERAIIELAEAFQWTIDFAMDPRAGDTFKVIYEDRYLNGEYVRPGKILAARYVNSGTPYELYYFSESDDNEGYFDENGNSVQKMFLKAPVAFKYISSGFTTGLRYVEAFNVSTGHRAIDYAAPIGTPIRSVGDGTITSAAWSGAYGNMVSVRHNETYSTNYAHMSKMAVRKGDKVKQGDIIGYVGSTGFSTGPHLHYEMLRNGVKINPLIEVLPPGAEIKAENKDRFFEAISLWQKELKEE